MKIYKTEREGQIEFFEQFGINYQEENVLIDYTDGVYNGTILEFKLNINDVNKVLFQAIKYLSRMRIKGEPVPANILLISLNTRKCYMFESKDFFNEIHKIYVGSASTSNEGFVNNYKAKELDYSSEIGANNIKKILNTKKYLKIEIDESCIVGWAEKYYRENPKAQKGDFIGDEKGTKNTTIGEIREPVKFKEYILPYKKGSNEKFKYLMDKLNDSLHKKDLGAFYTPIEYCKKSAELVREAIKRVPKGNDYIILDRCAGTGNLEVVLNDEELSHCVLSTIEYFEYKVLLERLGSKVRAIIPPIESQVVYSAGMINNADAMSEEYLNNETIKQYINNKKCTIILYENPPYNDTSSITGVYDEEGNKHVTKNKESYVFKKMNEIKDKFRNNNISTVRDFANRFIWSGFEYYLRQETDSYIVFSPVKYFKSLGIIDDEEKKFIKGFLFNRLHFHATPSAISCILWSNGKQKNNKKFKLDIADIINEKIVNIGNSQVNKVNSSFNDYQEKVIGKIEWDICCNSKGKIETNKKLETKCYLDSDIIGYFCLVSASFDLGRLPYFNGRGFYLTLDNYYKKLPLFCAKKYSFDKWYEKDFYFLSADKKEEYVKDKTFLKNCFLFSVLTDKNHMCSLMPFKNKFLQNELCFEKGTVASKQLDKLKLNKDEENLIDIYNKILKEAKKTKKYNKNLKYGTYQIDEDLNTWHINKENEKEKIYDYPQLNSDINTLKKKLKTYYDKYIKEKLFEYELLK